VDLVDALFGPRELLQLPDPGRSIVRWSDLGPAAVSLPHKKTGNVYETVLFTTYTLPCFTDFCKPFYSSSGEKIVPNNIGDLLTPRRHMAAVTPRPPTGIVTILGRRGTLLLDL